MKKIIAKDGYWFRDINSDGNWLFSKTIRIADDEDPNKFEQVPEKVREDYFKELDEQSKETQLE